MVRLERHPSGPRVHVLGRRVHECHLGLALGGAAASLAALEHRRIALALAALALWLVAKDWRDLFPRLRDTATWRLGIHRVPAPLRERRRLERLPSLAAAVALAVGAVNLASALTPNVAWRGHLLLQVEPVEFVPLFHTLAVPASVALIICAFYLERRRHRAWQAALALLVVLGALDLVKGFDFEEAALSFAVAACSGWGEARSTSGTTGPSRAPSCARSQQRQRALPSWRVFVVAIAHVYSPRLVARETADLLLWRQGPVAFGDDAAWLPFAAGAIALGGLLGLAYLAFRPLAPPRRTRRIGASPTSSSACTAATRSPSSSSAATRSTSSARTGTRSSGTGSRGT